MAYSSAKTAVGKLRSITSGQSKFSGSSLSCWGNPIIRSTSSMVMPNWIISNFSRVTRRCLDIGAEKKTIPMMRNSDANTDRHRRHRSIVRIRRRDCMSSLYLARFRKQLVQVFATARYVRASTLDAPYEYDAFRFFRHPRHAHRNAIPVTPIARAMPIGTKENDCCERSQTE